MSLRNELPGGPLVIGREPTTARSAARIAGYLYLAIFFLAIFANFLVLSRLVETGDPAATMENIAGAEGQFRWGLVAFTAVFVIDVVIAWALYVFFREQHRDLSLMTAWFRLVYTVMLGVGLVFYFLVLKVIGDAAHVNAFDPAQRESQVALLLDGFDFAWLVGLACFGVHLILLGMLARRTAEMPRALGFFLMAAGVAYIVDTLARSLLASYDDYESLFLAIVAIPSVAGELWLGLWLLLRGGAENAAPATGS